MAFINAIEGVDEFVRLDLITTDGTDPVTSAWTAAELDSAFGTSASALTAGTLSVPALQEITVNATPGIFRWKQLDALSEFAVTTPSTNSINSTLVLDPVTWYDGATLTGNKGIFGLTNDKSLVAFRFYWQGDSQDDRYVQGLAYISGIAATVSPDSPVWTSPITLEVVGNYVSGTLAA